MYPSFSFEFVQGINANSGLRINIREFNEELLAFSKAQTRRSLPFPLPVQIDIDYRLQEFVVFGLGLGKLLNERVEDALGLFAVLLGSIAVEIRQLLGRRTRKERIDDCRCEIGLTRAGWMGSLVRRELIAIKEYGGIRIPRNSNNFEALDDLQMRYSPLSKIHLPVPSRRPSPIRLWWLVYGTLDIHSRISDLLDPVAV